ncbi:MAG: hypothetical protein AAF821_07765 [Cyanobacteria bacterium P01_D01_bin.156]
MSVFDNNEFPGESAHDATSGHHSRDPSRRQQPSRFPAGTPTKVDTNGVTQPGMSNS